MLEAVFPILGAVFERAYSNASATSMSSPSFMRSSPFNALGTSDSNQFQALPVEALTMAERLHGAGYLTGVFTSNPNAGAPSGLGRIARTLPGSTTVDDAGWTTGTTTTWDKTVVHLCSRYPMETPR
jgi:arylsulfatase A-like enzyme